MINEAQQSGIALYKLFIVNVLHVASIFLPSLELLKSFSRHIDELMNTTARCAMLATFVLSCAANGAGAEDFAFGADFSFLPQAESHGKVFKDNGVAKPGLEIFREHHY